MSLHTVSEYKDSIAAILSGIDLSNIDNLNGAIERAARVLVQKADVPEASGIQNIILYSGVTDYACDTRIFGTAVTDIRPQGISRNINDFVTKRPEEMFDRTKNYLYNGTMCTFEYINGAPIIRIVSVLPTAKVIIDPMTSIGNWIAAGSASNLAQDTTVFYQSPASLRFTLTGSSTGTLTETLSNPLDLSTYENVGVAFLAIYLTPSTTATDLTNIDIRLGADSANYNHVTATTGFLGAWVSGEWLLVAFDYAASTQVGTNDWSNINYVQCRFAHTSTITNMRVGGLWMSLPTPAQILYQSAAIFLALGASNTTTAITNNTDTIILNDPAYNIFEYEGAISILQQTGASEGSAMLESLKRTLNGNGSTDIGLYAMFRGDNPSQELRLAGTWYDNSSGYDSNNW